MKQNFRVYIQPISVNSFYCGDRRYKSAAAREWTLQTLHQLNQTHILEKMTQLRDYFNPLMHTYQISLKFAYPVDKFKTKNGSISSKTIDITNCEKHLVDLLFLNKFYDEFANLNVDDRYLTKMSSEKLESENGEYYVDISLEINNLLKE